MNIKFTRKQELRLINMGVQTLLDKALGKVGESQEVRVSAAKASWTPARRKKFAATMKRKFAAGKLRVGSKHKHLK